MYSLAQGKEQVHVLLTMALIIAAVSTYVEIKLVHGSDWLRQLYTRGALGIEAVYWNTAGSFFLSWIVGILFGASGTTVFIGGVVSTGLSQAFFSIEGFMGTHDLTLERAKIKASQLQSSYRSKKNAVDKVVDDFRQPTADLLSLILVIIKIIVSPVVAIRKVSATYSAARTK